MVDSNLSFFLYEAFSYAMFKNAKIMTAENAADFELRNILCLRVDCDSGEVLSYFKDLIDRRSSLFQFLCKEV
jgi:hypothetical protein